MYIARLSVSLYEAKVGKKWALIFRWFDGVTKGS